MARIMTVQGALEGTKMGYCQMHEHVFVRATPNSKKNPALEISNEALSAQELKAYRRAGGMAILDAQPVGAGRDAAALERLSRESGVTIITVTGYHLPGFYQAEHWIHSESKEQLQERFLQELREGCEEAKNVRPGAVKAAIPASGPEGRFETLIRAAAGAAAGADVPLILHTEKGAGAVKAVRLCEQEGLDPRRIAVCHADRQAEAYQPHEEIARTGAYLEYDTIGRYKYHDDESERRLILHMLEQGCIERLLLSLDTTAARLTSYGGEIGLDYMRKNFLPGLRAAGLSQGEIDQITVENPRRIFE